MKVLLIVESPSKCKVIEQYLGQGFMCLATCGHVRKMVPTAEITPENYVYEIDESKRRYINQIKREMKTATDVILATDDDREGEAIAWHICQIFSLNIEKTSRIRFHEITEQAIKNAIANPQRINMNIVFSQQTRNMLDILIGYNATPLLWKNINEKNISAGRCQTPALKLVYENQKKIDEQILSLTNYKVYGNFTPKHILFECDQQFTQETAPNFLEEIKNSKFRFKRESTEIKRRDAPCPLTTSGLQQLASNILNISPQDTMTFCQKLYESGYITYMRTDSKAYSTTFLEKAKDFIEREYGENTYREVTTTTTEGAHEAIRPTDLKRCEIEDSKSKIVLLYRLIWERTIESCMKCEEYIVLKSLIYSEKRENIMFVNKCHTVVCRGWNIFNGDNKTNEQTYQYLMHVSQDSEVSASKIKASMIQERGVGHLSEASLINKLETLGIGRPSTFASIVDKIKKRNYVAKENVTGTTCSVCEYELDVPRNSLKTTMQTVTLGSEKRCLILKPIGKQVAEYVCENIPTIFDYDYTSKMEKDLDEIRDGTLDWKIMFHHYREVVIPPPAPAPAPQLEPEKTEEEDKKERVIEIRRGKFGKYAVVDGVNYSLSKLGNRPIENISMKEVEDIIAKKREKEEEIVGGVGGVGIVRGALPSEGVIRIVSDGMSIRTGKWGNYIFHKTKEMKKPEFHKLTGFKGNYMTCDVSLLFEFIIKNK